MVPFPFSMSAGEHEGVLVVRFAGRLESPWADEVHRTLLRHSPTALWVDLSELTGIDPPGLAALVAIRQDVVSGGGRFVLRGARDTVSATLAAAGLGALVDDERDPHEENARNAEHVGDIGPIGPTGPVTQLPLKGGRDARRPAAGTPKVA